MKMYYLFLHLNNSRSWVKVIKTTNNSHKYYSHDYKLFKYKTLLLYIRKHDVGTV